MAKTEAGSAPACYCLFLGSNPYIPQKAQTGDITKRVANAVKSAKKYKNMRRSSVVIISVSDRITTFAESGSMLLLNPDPIQIRIQTKVFHDIEKLVEVIAYFRSGVISTLCLNIFFTYLPGSGKRQDWVYLSSEQGVFNKLDFNIVIMASFKPNLNFI
jgi:hypothetical protein